MSKRLWVEKPVLSVTGLPAERYEPFIVVQDVETEEIKRVRQVSGEGKFSLVTRTEDPIHYTGPDDQPRVVVVFIETDAELTVS
jgi:hypothetical protein